MALLTILDQERTDDVLEMGFGSRRRRINSDHKKGDERHYNLVEGVGVAQKPTNEGDLFWSSSIVDE